MSNFIQKLAEKIGEELPFRYIKITATEYPQFFVDKMKTKKIGAIITPFPESKSEGENTYEFIVPKQYDTIYVENMSGFYKIDLNSQQEYTVNDLQEYAKNVTFHLGEQSTIYIQQDGETYYQRSSDPMGESVFVLLFFGPNKIIIEKNGVEKEIISINGQPSSSEIVVDSDTPSEMTIVTD